MSWHPFSPLSRWLDRRLDARIATDRERVSARQDRRAAELPGPAEVISIMMGVRASEEMRSSVDEDLGPPLLVPGVSSPPELASPALPGGR